jgi:pilus assembly protein CpaE
VPADRAVPVSINRGVPLVLDAPKHAVAHAIRQIAAAVGPSGPAPTPTPAPAHRRNARRGFLRRKESLR